MVGLFDVLPFCNGETSTSQSNDVEAGEEIDLVDDAVGRDVAGHAGVALHHGEVANVNELVDGGSASKEDAVAQFAMPGHHDVVRDDVVIADLDIVTEMGNGHEKIVISNDGVAPFPGAPVDGDMLAEAIAFTDENARLSGDIKTEILGSSPDDGAVTDRVV